MLILRFVHIKRVMESDVSAIASTTGLVLCMWLSKSIITVMLDDVAQMSQALSITAKSAAKFARVKVNAMFTCVLCLTGRTRCRSLGWYICTWAHSMLGRAVFVGLRKHHSLTRYIARATLSQLHKRILLDCSCQKLLIAYKASL